VREHGGNLYGKLVYGITHRDFQSLDSGVRFVAEPFMTQEELSMAVHQSKKTLPGQSVKIKDELLPIIQNKYSRTFGDYVPSRLDDIFESEMIEYGIPVCGSSDCKTVYNSMNKMSAMFSQGMRLNENDQLVHAIDVCQKIKKNFNQWLKTNGGWDSKETCLVYYVNYKRILDKEFVGELV